MSLEKNKSEISVLNIKNEKRNLIPIRTKALKLILWDIIEFDCYIKSLDKYLIFASKGTTYDNELDKKLSENEIVFVDKSDYKRYIEDNLQNIVNNDEISLDKKSEIIYDTATNIMQNLFENPNTNIKNSQKVITPLIDQILTNDGALKSLMKVTSYDYYTYTHSINVTIYSISIAKTLLFSKDELHNLGISAILHDIGKSKISPDIINKAGKLSDEEFLEIKKHPIYGYNIAVENGINDKAILAGIRGHHEKYDGSGYPDKLSRDEISVFAEIIAIADIFDALTTKRSYKEPFSTFDTLLLMKKEMANNLNAKFLNKFITLLR